MLVDSPVVAVFGSRNAADGGEAYATARAVGKVLAGLGYVVANGGYGGTMEASARGAKEAGGATIGVVCSIWRDKPNQYMDRVIRSSRIIERLDKLMALGNAGYVVLPGETGTLEELASAWNGILLGEIPRRPLACVGDYWRPVVQMIGKINRANAEAVRFIKTAEGLGEFFPSRRAT